MPGRQEVGHLHVKLSADLAEFRTAMDGMSNQVAKAGRNLQQMGGHLTRAFTLPIMGAGVAAGKLAMDFEESMSKITGLVGIARDEVGAMGQEILELGPKVGRGPRELADALFFVTSAGLRGQAAMDALTASAQAASAGLGETKVVADAVTSAINAYGAANIGAAQATAILVATVREGKAEASTIAPVLGRIIPVAAELGVSFHQVGAALAAMTRLGLDANESATALRGILMAIQKPGAEAEKVLAEFGLSAAGLRQQLREEGLLSVLLTLRQRFGDNEDALNRVVPNVRALAGVLALVGTNVEQTEAIFASLAKTTEKDLADAFATAEQTARVKFNKAMAEVQAGMIRLGEEILPAVTPWLERIAQAVGDASRAFSAMSDDARQSSLVMAAVVAGIGPALTGLGLMTMAISALISPVGLAVLGIAALAAVVVSVHQEMTRAAREARRYGEEVAAAARKALEAERDARLEALRATYADELQVHEDRLRMSREEADAKRTAAEDAYRAAVEANDRELEDARRAHDEKRRLLDAEYLAKLKNLDGMTQAAVKHLEAEIRAIDDAAREEERARRDAEDEAKLAGLRGLLAAEEDADARVDLARQLADLEADIQQRKLAASREAEKRALRDEIELWRDRAREQRDILREEYDAERTVLDDGLAATVARLEAEKPLLEAAHLADLKRMEDSLAAFVAAEQGKLEATKARFAEEEKATATHFDTILAMTAEQARKLRAAEIPPGQPTEFEAPWQMPLTPAEAGELAERERLADILRQQQLDADLRRLRAERDRLLELQGEDLPGVPRLQHGGRITGEGWAMVGERGPELVGLPRGATVVPAGRAGGFQDVTVNAVFNIYDATDPQKVARIVDKQIRLTFRNLAREGA